MQFRTSAPPDRDRAMRQVSGEAAGVPLVRRGQVVAISMITMTSACTFPDVTYVDGGGGQGTTASGVGGDSMVGNSSASSAGSASSSTSSSGCTLAVPADCSCPGTCALPNASSSCTGAVCVIDDCASNHADCNHDRSDGCEADLRQDDLHCGACGNACVVSQHCKNGKCK